MTRRWPASEPKCSLYIEDMEHYRLSIPGVRYVTRKTFDVSTYRVKLEHRPKKQS